jgi:histidyl-tRNA synthetase
MERAEIEKRIVEQKIDAAKVTALFDLIAQPMESRATLAALEPYTTNATVKAGLDELRAVYETTLALGVPADALAIKLSILRGLDYYTGTVYETFLDDHPRLGSVCSGGRYENLAGHYTKSKLPGVGISIGATRLFSQLIEQGVIAAGQAVAQVLVASLDATLAREYAAIAAELRAAGLNVEVYGDGGHKFGKQIKYAEKAGIPLIAICGSSEHANGRVQIKDMRVRDANLAQGAQAQNQEDVARADLVARVRAKLS